MKLSKGTLITISLILSSISFAQLVNAKANYPSGQPIIYNNAIGCTSCHSGTPQTENNANTTYGILFGNAYDDDRGTLASAYLSLERYDIDRDGFSNGQELRQTSGYFNSSTLTPALTAPDINAGNVMAKAVSAGAVAVLTDPGTSFLNDMATFERTTLGVPLTTTDFMYKFGGMQAGATGTFYDENNTPIAANSADGIFAANLIPADTTLDGSMRVTVKDDGVFDLYSQAAFIRIAKARTPAFTPVPNPELINPNAQIDPYAVISSSATIDNYAVIDAYAIVDNNATVGAYSHVGSYAFIPANISIFASALATDPYAVVDPYVEVKSSITTPGTTSLPNGVGYVKATFSITTTAPLIPSIVGGSDGNEGGDSAGGLHCMTTGLGLQGLMFLSLFGTGYLLRRKKK